MDPRIVHEWIDQLYDKYHERLYKIAYKQLWNKSLAEDMVQEVFLTLTVKYDEVKDKPDIGGWLGLAVKNKVKNEHQRRHYQYEKPLDDTKSGSSFRPVEDSFVNDFFSVLPPGLSSQERRILFYRIEAKYSYEQISLLMGLAPSTCRSKFTHAKLHCKILLIKNKNFSKSNNILAPQTNIKDRSWKDV